MQEPDDIVALALGYPYPRPAHSYLFSGGEVQELPPETDFSGRVPVLACGSNGSPVQLQRKYKHFPETSIPVTAATLQDVICVYSAHFTGYGSVAAALSAAPGARSSVHINWLTPDQLLRMHETEAVGQNYCYAELSGLELHCSHNGALDTAFAYVSLRGSLMLEGAPVTLGGIDCLDAPFPTLDQAEVQRRLRDIFAPGMDLHDFIRQNVADASLRAERTARLSRHAQVFDHPGMKTLLD
ncbi:MAG: hypothetical protein CMN56_11905 [Sneathiella sp.]|mgnify:FL=1|uniref:hypothetical protein n=1 Tax=Sneathiella sp. TaxID=1964365 RepID=UPI000C5F81F7|nr:hypothetical protein [Sneathiella sp.]MAZ03832.1 hypothetical protein [Sneathiella sp.]